MNKNCLNDMCRFCLTSRAKTPVLMLLELTKSQRDKFQELTNASLIISEDLPANICSDCGDKLESFHFYRCQLIRKQNELAMFLNMSSIDSESQQPDTKPSELNIDNNNSEALEELEETEEFLEAVEDFEILEDDDAQDSRIFEQSHEAFVTEEFDDEIVAFEENGEFEGYRIDEPEQEVMKVESETDDMEIFAIEIAPEKRSTRESVQKTSKVPRNEEIKYGNIEPHLVLTSNYLKMFKVSSRVENGEIVYFCETPECNEEFTTENDLKRHQKSHMFPVAQEDLKNVCQICGKFFQNRIHLRSHLRNHDKTLKYQCTYEGCTKAFRVKHHLANHIRAHTQESPFACNFEGCVARFRQKHALTIHIRKHTGDFIKCELCDSPFVTQYQLSRHLEKCNGTYRPMMTRATPRIRSELTTFNYRCPIGRCDESFKAKVTLTRHLFKIHQIEVTSTTCVLCCQEFANPQILKSHLREHLPFTCSLCGISFKNEENFNIHQSKSHEKDEVRSHQCQICSASFKRAEHLRTHIAYKHYENRPYTCDHCAFTSPTRADVTSHMKTHMQKSELQCQFCDFVGRTETTMKNHMKIFHSAECSQHQKD